MALEPKADCKTPEVTALVKLVLGVPAPSNVIAELLAPNCKLGLVTFSEKVIDIACASVRAGNALELKPPYQVNAAAVKLFNIAEAVTVGAAASSAMNAIVTEVLVGLLVALCAVIVTTKLSFVVKAALSTDKVAVLSVPAAGVDIVTPPALEKYL